MSHSVPLAEKLRPKRLTQFVGQKDVAGRDGVIKKLIVSGKKSDFFPSLIFWGPPGTGKTTLARIIATELKREFFEFSAVSTSIKEIQEVIKSQHPLLSTQSPIMFIDEIHRFNKAQQDKLLPHVERGDIVFIGATTENPSFEVIAPLLSRSRVIVLEKLSEKELNTIISRAEKELSVKLNKGARKFLIESANGDARAALNTIEIAANLTPGKKTINIEAVETALQRRYLAFDKRGDEYYNVISAFIKSMRASNPDAALYYLARMIEAGQDPLYIARRMVVFASEDVGMGQPTALVVANEVFQACTVIGYPECAINLAHGVVYLCTAKKDRSSYEAYFAAVADVKKHGNLPIPKSILNAPTKLMKEQGYGKDYEMYTDKNLLPTKIKGKKYYKKEN